MKRVLFNVFLVTIGAAVGSVVTWKVVKTKYEQIVQEEIDSVKEEYQILKDALYSAEAAKVNQKVAQDLQNDDYFECPDDDMDEEDEYEQETFTEYHKLASAYRSSEDVEDDDKEGGMGENDEAPYINGPYVISPDDFRCSPPGYNAQALDYFSDGILADSWGSKLDIEDTIGEESLNHFGEYTDDIVYVRNDRYEIDYEVTCDLREYAEVYDPQMNA